MAICAVTRPGVLQLPMADSAVLKVLRDALENDPSNIALRLHLASLLIGARQYSEALEQLTIVLNASPSHQEALQLAADAAEQSGDKIRAHGYRRLHEALSWNQAKNLIDSTDAERDGDLTPGPERGRKRPADDIPSIPPPENRERLRVGGDDSDTPTFDDNTERPTITLADVAGLEDVKRRLNIAFLAPMRNPEMMKLYGRSLRGGLLLYGPPGCGKTYIARAIAGELGARFLPVGLSDVLDMWLGNSEKNLHEVFESARRNRPCVLFFDEIDALGRKRSLMTHSAGRTVINQLLAEMDSVGSDNDGLFILAATNHPWDVDNALRRPGRLDRTILVVPPDPAARSELFHLSLRGRPVEKLDYELLVRATDAFSGADIAHLVESAAELAMEASLAAGTARPISMNDFKAALRDVKPSTRAWFQAARNYAMFANDGGAYDELLDYLKAHRLT